MTDYYGKVIELLAIEGSTATDLRIRLSFMNSVELLWVTDNETAANLAAISDFDGVHKYRISLHTMWDINKQQYIGSVTRTYRDHSEPFPFACSIQFRDELEYIMKARHLDDLHTLPFLSTYRPDADLTEETQIKEVIAASSSARKRSRLPFKLVGATMVSLIIVLLLSSFNYSYPDDIQLQPATTASVEAETSSQWLAVNRMTKITHSVVSAPKVEQTDNKQEDIIDTLPSAAVPQLELDELISFSIPKGYVALTFDDGPSKYSMDIMNVLQQYKVGGTFFFIGTNVKKHPDYVQAISAGGYSVGSHSMTHSQMSNLSLKQQEAEMTQAASLIEHITNEKLVLFRPPYGAFDDQTESLSQQLGNKLVLWNRDTEDWLTRDEDKILDYIQQTEASGSIILLHESQAVVDALPRIITHLQNQGLNIVSLQ
ncbi:polysaccharide deacetylase family protein [Paenibacillus solani]|uniref:polysaccharide deacetylase family protein n=1 Tax=Paenibacillus solani TaxID=1705565 RepID=UPI003D2E41A3